MGEKALRPLNSDPVVSTGPEGVVKGNPDEFYGQAIVAFLDLLGFNSAIHSRWPDGPTSAVRAFLNVRESLPSAGKQVEWGIFSKPDESDLVTYRCRFQGFADSLVISVAVPGGINIGEFSIASAGVFTNVREAWKACICGGFTIRGAIEVGPIFWNLTDIVGPALSNAITIEKRDSSSSRVLVGPAFVRGLVKASRSWGAQGEWLSPRQLLMIDGDGLVCLSPKSLIGPAGKDPLGILQRLDQLRGECPLEAKAKYDGLLRALKNPQQVRTPTVDDLEAYAKSWPVGAPEC